ncbi:MAG: helix-hairpin-helix domain-containing protein [Firmicutes bacterium]|nr:helix-hairpin-helix domain-containing protein [Bacillota bacterium]
MGIDGFEILRRDAPAVSVSGSFNEIADGSAEGFGAHAADRSQRSPDEKIAQGAGFGTSDPSDEHTAQSESSQAPETSGEKNDAASSPTGVPEGPGFSGLIDINSADSKTLRSLNGIGPVKAQAIIEYRKAYGGFVCAEEILQVKGIGKATYEKIKDRIYVKTRDRQN